MKRKSKLIPEFIEFVPSELKDGIIYISMIYGTAVHKCCCGCGEKVVTPFSPTDWKLIFDGETISLYPSVGNWSFKCQSHYWITNSKVRWADRWSKDKINAARAHDRAAKERYFGTADTAAESGKLEPGIWQKVKKWWQGL
jgi:hypothetical protein